MRAETGLLIGGVIGLIAGAAVSQRWGSDIGAAVASIPQPVATIIAAVLGFGVIAWQARLGFQGIIAGQEHRARLEAQARLDQDHLERKNVEADRLHEKRVLAAALHGEMIALLRNSHDYSNSLLLQSTLWEHIAKEGVKDLVAEFPMPTYRVPVYESMIPKLGLLGASIAGDVAIIFSKATQVRAMDVKLTPDFAARLARAANEGTRDWGQDMVHVGKRLQHVQFDTPDPGPLFKDQARREAEKEERGKEVG